MDPSSMPGMSVNMGYSGPKIENFNQNDVQTAIPMREVQMAMGHCYVSSNEMAYRVSSEPSNPFTDFPDNQAKLSLCVNMTKAEYEAGLQGASFTLANLMECTTRAVMDFFISYKKSEMGKEISKVLKGFSNIMCLSVLKMDPDNGPWFKMFFNFYEKFIEFCSGKVTKLSLETDLRRLYMEAESFLVNVREVYDCTVSAFKDAMLNTNMGSTNVLKTKIGQDNLDHFGVNFALAMLGLRSIENVLANM